MKNSIEKFFRDKKKRRWFLGGLTLLVLILIAVLLVRCGSEDADAAVKPVLRVETPQRLSRSQTDEFVLDVTISALGDALYPAMSMSLRFDPSCLEFLGVEEGNVFILGGEDTTSSRTLPDWSCNPEQCNASGLINIMYLDLTGGKYAFSKDLLVQEDHVVLRLRFRLRGSARVGDVYDLIFEDAVFAASDETQSLAMTTGTLGVRDGKIIVGE